MNIQADYWNHRYQNELTGWDRGEPHPALLDWLEGGELRRCSIIVPGCGMGHEVMELVQRDFKVTGIDYADEPIKQLDAKLKAFATTSRVVQQSVFEYHPGEPVDAVYEQTCLCAIAPQQREEYEKAIYQWLKPGGRFFALFAQTEAGTAGLPVADEAGPPFHCDLRAMQSVFPKNRWCWPDQPPVLYPHPSGKLTELAVVLRKQQPGTGPAK